MSPVDVGEKVAFDAPNSTCKVKRSIIPRHPSNTQKANKTNKHNGNKKHKTQCVGAQVKIFQIFDAWRT